MKVNFDDKRPEERRIILVASDEKYQEIIAQIDWVKIVKLLLLGAPIASSFFGPAVARSLYLAATFQATLPQERSFFERMTTKGEVPFPHLSPREAVERFGFDHGHPADGEAYILNECVPNYYVAPALYNERMAQEKLAAFVQIVAALGAKRVELVSGRVLARKAAAEAGIPLEDVAIQIKLSAEFNKDHSVQRQVLVEFPEPDTEPYMPAQFEAWLKEDPMIRALVKDRLEHKTSFKKTEIHFQESMQIDGEFLAEFVDRKIKVGGSYRYFTSSVWGFEVQFWPFHRS